MIFFLAIASDVNAQNLVVDGNISSSNVNWGGGASEAPYGSAYFENTYVTGGCNANYIMEVDQASNPSQTVNGFVGGLQYVVSFRYCWRSSGCSPSSSPTTLNVAFSDATSVLNSNISVPNTQTAWITTSITITNNASTSHTLVFTNPGNTNTCGVLVDDISIVKLSSPGGIGTGNLTFWLNAGTINATDASGVFGWITKGSNVVTLNPSCGAAPVYHTGTASNANGLVANYNPYVQFNGSSQYLEYTSARLSLIDVSAGGTGGTFFSAFTGGATNNTFYFDHQGATATSNRIIAKNSEFVMGSSGTVGTGNDIPFTKSTRMTVMGFEGKSNGVTVRDQNGTHIATANNGSADVDFLEVGVRKNNAGAYSQYFDGTVSEIMIFNTQLTVAQMQRVRSYLSIKYGTTLNNNSNTGGIDERNYLASDGNTLWDYTGSNSAYHNNVTVIGRDDNSGLDQRKSISTTADANSNSGNAMLIVDNSGSFSSDLSFLAIGHNGIASNLAMFSDFPAGIQSRLQRIWKFQKTGSGVANTVSLSFDMTGYAPLTGSDLRLLVSSSTVFAGASIVTGSYAAPYFTVNLPTTGGVFFTIASINVVQSPLPVELLSFNATPSATTVLLDWNTATEMNNDHFTIERSKDASSFEYIGEVKGSGTSSSAHAYHLTDETPFRGTSYYRLKQTDYNGQFTYSNIVPVQMNMPVPFNLSIFPNPTDGEFNIRVESDKSEVLVVVYGALGNEVYSKIVVGSTSGSSVIAVDSYGY